MTPLRPILVLTVGLPISSSFALFFRLLLE